MSETEIIEGEATEEHETLPVVRQPSESAAMVTRDELSVVELVKQADIIHDVMQRAMKQGIHYGVVPGTGGKPSLLKPGAEKLCVLFRLAPEYETEKIWHEDGHLTVITKCILRHIPTSMKIAEGDGLCTTKESKYATRNAGRVCPDCGADAIIKGKEEYGGGWICFKKKGGCGAKFPDGDEAIEGQQTGKIDNPDLADSYNTVLKMSAKRAFLAAVLNGTAASDVFTQDMAEEGSHETQRASGESGGGASGQQQRQQPRQRQESKAPADPYAIDPGQVFLENAPRGDKLREDSVSLLMEVDPTVDWRLAITTAAESCFGSPDIPKERMHEFLRRFSNASRRVRNHFDPNAVPPIHDEEIVRSIAWAFDGAVVELTRSTADQKTGGDSA